VFAGEGWRCSKGWYVYLKCFEAAPKNFGIFTMVLASVGQVHPTKENWPPHWDHGKNHKRSFKLPINILKYQFPKLNQGAKVQICKFCGLIWPFKWVWGFFTVIPMWGGQFTLAVWPKAQLIMALRATWALAERLNNALGEIGQQQETCRCIIFRSVLSYSPKWLS